MEIFTISDPADRNNPLETLSITEPLMYHGTHSMFGPLIEEHGFCFKNFDVAYGEEIRTIVTACETLHYRSTGYVAAKGFDDKGYVYFSASFPSAKEYAAIGGERIDGALQAAKAFIEFANNDELVKQRTGHWEKVLADSGSHWPTEQVLLNLKNVQLVRRLAAQVEISLAKLSYGVAQGHPIVYAVRSDRKWCREFSAAITDDIHREPFGGIRCINVPVDRIVAKVGYPHGILPESEQSL